MAGESWKSHKNTTRERDLDRDHADQVDGIDWDTYWTGGDEQDTDQD